MTTVGFQPRGIEERDEAPHEHGGEPGWTECIGFNFFDEASGFGGIVELDFRPGDRRASGEVALFLPGGGVATALARAANVKRSDLTVGRIVLECAKEMRTWRLRCTDLALVFPTAESASLAGGTERAGKASQIELDVTFEAFTEPTGWAARRTDVDEMHFASIVSCGVFEQAGTYRGTVRVGARRATVDGHGFRIRTWGVREPHGFWYAVAFAPDLAVSMTQMRISDQVVSHGSLYRGGTRLAWKGAGHESVRERRVAIVMEDVGGERIEVSGDILATIPPGADSAHPFRSMTRFRCGAHEALGLVETRALVL